MSSTKQRVKLSRLLIDLNHWKRNCQIKGVEEIERAIKAIKTSRNGIQRVKAMMQDSNVFPKDNPKKWIESLEEVSKVRKQIIVDMEDEEAQIRLMIFEKNLELILQKHQTINYEQFKNLEVEFKKRLKSHSSKQLCQKFKDAKERVSNCVNIIAFCPTKALLENEAREQVSDLCNFVNFEQ